MGLDKLKRGYLIQFKRYVDQLTGSSGHISGINRTDAVLRARNLLAQGVVARGQPRELTDVLVVVAVIQRRRNRIGHTLEARCLFGHADMVGVAIDVC